MGEELETETIKPYKISQRDWYTLVLILTVATYLRLMMLRINLGYAQEFRWMPFSIAVVGLIWWIAHRYINRTAAILAAFMAVFSPWALFYSLHALNIFQLFLLMTLGFALLAFIDEKPWAILILIMCLGIGILIFPFFLIGLPNSIPNSNVLEVARNLLLYFSQYTAGVGLTRGSHIPYPSEIWVLFLGTGAVIGLPALWFRLRTMFKLVLTWIIGLLAFILIFGVQSSFIFMYGLPAFSLLVGAGVAWLIKLLPGKPYSRMIVLAVYGAIFLSQGLWWLGVVRYLQSNP